MSTIGASLKEKFLNGALSITLMSVFFGFLLGGIIMLLSLVQLKFSQWVHYEGERE